MRHSLGMWDVALSDIFTEKTLEVIKHLNKAMLNKMRQIFK